MDQDLPCQAPETRRPRQPDAHPADAQPARRRGLPQLVQALLVGVGFAGVLAAFLMQPAAAPPAGEPVAPALGPAQEAAFKPNDRQWAGLRLQRVQMRLFQSAAQTEGKIALDDDLVTPVYSPYSGRVTRLPAHAGDVVAPGDPLFAVQATELAQAQNDLITAVANLRTSKAQLALAETSEKRQHALYDAQGAALKDWQQSQVDLATARGGLNIAQIALAAVRNRLRILGKSEADIDTMEQTVDPLRLNAETVVRAPIGGTVVQRQVGLGQNIISASSGAASPVFMIGDLSKVWLVANAQEEEAPLLHKGDPVEVQVPAYPNRVFQARLAYVAASLDPMTHRLPVRAEVDNADGALKPEMFARFRIITGPGISSPSVPASAVVYEGDSAHVWVADPAKHTLEIRSIRVGQSYDGFVQVLNGLSGKDQVVTAGAVFIDRAVSDD